MTLSIAVIFIVMMSKNRQSIKDECSFFLEDESLNDRFVMELLHMGCSN